MIRYLGLVMLAGGLVSSGCTSAPTSYERARLELPSAWSAGAASAIGNAQAWWKNFHDAQLDALVDRALARNNDFAAAALRVRRARLQAELTGTNRTPAVVASISSGASHRFDPPLTQHASGLFGALSYELDLWGRLGSERDASQWEAEASEADCRAFAGVLVASVAKLYWQLAYLNQLLAMTDADIDYAQRTLALARAKFAAGALSGLNTAQAELNLSTQQATRTQLVQARTETRNALAILFDQAPQALGEERATLPDGPLPAVGAGVPADVLAQRPDLQAAEWRLREALAGVDLARTSFYPSVALTGSLGTASTSLLSFLANPVATLGVGIALPFIQWNTAQLTGRIAASRYEESVVLFRQRLYTALAEVENALSARTQLQAEEATLNASVAQARRAESISRTRFDSGASEVQLWLDAQVRVRAVERSLLANRLNQFANQADLYRALGLGVAPGGLRCGLSRSLPGA